jgi:quinol monooxygenase YgiN
MIATCLLTLLGCAHAPVKKQGTVVRVAKLQIDPGQLESYIPALKEEIEASVRIEPGVLALYAVSEKDKPTNIMVFEIYADENAYRAYRNAHFKNIKRTHWKW